MWKWILVIVGVMVLSCVGAGAWLQYTGTLKTLQEKLSPETKALKVRLEPVVRGDLVRTVSAPGLIEPRTKIEISAQVAARIIELPFREGQSVRKGAVVVKLDAVDLQAVLDSARAGLKSEEARLQGARASFEESSLNLGRQRELFSTKDNAKAVLENAEAEYARAEAAFKSAQFAVDIARANVTRAEKDLSNTVITAPMDGTITKLDAEVGELVLVGTLNNPASVIMEVADLSDMLFKAKVDEANVALVKPGQNAKVFVNAFGEKPYDAVVERVKLYRQRDTDGTVFFETELKLRLPPDVTVRSGLTANADVEVETISNVLLVPSQSVLDRAMDELPKSLTDGVKAVDKAKKYVRVVFETVDGEARARVVETGASDLTRTIVVKGLGEGQKVISGPFKSLQTMKDKRKVEEDTGKPEDKSGNDKTGNDKNPEQKSVDEKSADKAAGKNSGEARK